MSFPSYQQTLSFLFGLQKSGIKLGLETIGCLLAVRGNPHRKYLTVHVAGTSGKGSVATVIARMLTAAGYRTGLYTSPHFLDFRERITVDGRKISHRAVRAGTARLIHSVSRRRATYFETVTALAFDYFALRRVDIAVIEVGLGGRYDATNVIAPVVSVITPVSIDHVEYLGSSLAGIAAEKAGIIKPGVPCVTAPQVPEVRRVLRRRALSAGADIYPSRNLAAVTPLPGGLFRMERPDGTGFQFRCPLTGPHQVQNLQTALAAAELLRGILGGLNGRTIGRALAGTVLPGRMQVVSRKPRIILDMAHNPAKCRALVTALRREFSYKKICWVTGIMKDKDIPGIIGELARVPSAFFITRPRMERAAAPGTIARAVKKCGKKARSLPDIREAIGCAVETAGPDDIVCVTGSVYTVAAAMQAYSWPGF